MIIKPAPETSHSAYAIAEALDAAGLPAGLVSVLPAGRERAEYLVSHPGIDKISFTGSTATGRRLGVIAAEQFKRTGLELGGKSAGIVLPDADSGELMAAIVNGTTINSGQACSLLSRILVPRARRARVLPSGIGRAATRGGGPVIELECGITVYPAWTVPAEVPADAEVAGLGQALAADVSGTAPAALSLRRPTGGPGR